MSLRIAGDRGVERGAAVTLTVDGQAVTAFVGETLATALLAAGQTTLRRDTRGRPRGLFCNMGTCNECVVHVRRGNGPVRRLRACLVAVENGMVVTTGLHDG